MTDKVALLFFEGKHGSTEIEQVYGCVEFEWLQEAIEKRYGDTLNAIL